MAPAREVIDLETDSEDSDDQYDPPLDFNQLDELLNSPDEWQFAPPIGFGRAARRSPRLDNDENLAEALNNLQNRAADRPLPRMPRRAMPSTPVQQTASLPFRGSPATPSHAVAAPAPQDYDRCLLGILELFPDISHEHVKHLYDAEVSVAQSDNSSSVIIEHLIEKILDKRTFPKEKDRLNELKRKRAQDSDEEETAEYSKVEEGGAIGPYLSISKLVMQEDFTMIPIQYIDSELRETRQLYKAYQSLATSERDLENGKTTPYQRLKRPRKQTKLSTPGELDRYIDDTMSQAYGPAELKREIAAARKQRKKVDERQKVQKQKSAAEEARDKEAIEQGHVLPCTICYDEEIPDFKIIHCNNAEVFHFTCFDCIRKNADDRIGDQKWKLTCSHEDGCETTFSRSQLEKALDRKTLATLDSLQSQDEVGQANVKGLAECPFCNYKIICPPIKQDWEFRCTNPKCEKVSCRRCNRETHAPKSCKEAKEEEGIDERHTVEEAMTAAMIRICPKCKKGVVKDHGCNKVRCICGIDFCDICRADVSKDSYNHFSHSEDAVMARGMGLIGPKGKCALHDDTDARLEIEIKKAEDKAMKQIREENPDISEEDLKVKFKKGIPVGVGGGGRHGMPAYMRGMPGGGMPPGMMGFHPGLAALPFAGLHYGPPALNPYAPGPAPGPPPVPHRMPQAHPYPYAGPHGYMPFGHPPPVVGGPAPYDPYMPQPQRRNHPHGRRH